MTSKEYALIARGVVVTLQRALKPLRAELAEAKLELEQLKGAGFLRNAGDWRHGASYQLGDVARHSGSLWTCTKAHTAAGPTVDHSCWKLWVKRPKREKEAR